MSEWRRQSAAKQLSAYLREELVRGRWQGKMPGVITLARQLEAARNSVEEALRELEAEGILRNQGRGKGRVIDLSGKDVRPARLEVRILTYEASDRLAPDTVELLHDLEERGFVAGLASKNLTELRHDPSRVARLVKGTKADAWVVMSGSRGVLEWFVDYDMPCFAYAGRARQLPIASIAPDKVTPLRETVRRLVEFGHRRIVFMVREDRRVPGPGYAERVFLEELEAQGVTTGPYNLPHWEPSVAGFHAGLESLFRFTPPTAIITDEVPFAVATLQFCLNRGLKVPGDLSLVCGDPGPALEWCRPSVAHIAWDYLPVVRRIVRWVENISRGKDDRRKSYCKAVFVEGGSIGPAPSVR